MKKLIVLTGPESTAKSTLSKDLAEHFVGKYYPEFARTYLQDKSADYHYQFEDVEAIAKGQLSQYQEAVAGDSAYAFFDTWLIVTKVWFDWVYNRRPEWLEQSIADYPIGLYLLCKPDIPWEPDPLRENGGEVREKLYEIYKTELIQRNLPFVEIGGEGEERLQNAIAAINGFNFR
ncbi:AAA family ATPase [Mangrovibacterium diazotrophicum]|uniref:NadR type nicotinamide-nucleotide adenylyltransferase n=1 Tax=Mangrovibacterium diazotrophicum TaxID=1261403 RepID=A0A419W327_9BACT|nr:ATP-binding protein [Mangrovibacterium diazotrophicum]RKD89710.1 NadR type nicotinamide-nucleotide adenylyltransferase [Mangrovibacterium diazotrophicum]